MACTRCAAAFLYLCGITSTAAAAKIPFLNPDGGSFHDPSNWSGGIVPNRADDALFDLESDYVVTTTKNFRNQSIQAASGDVSIDLSDHFYQIQDVIRVAPLPNSAATPSLEFMGNSPRGPSVRAARIQIDGGRLINSASLSGRDEFDFFLASGEFQNAGQFDTRQTASQRFRIFDSLFDNTGELQLSPGDSAEFEITESTFQNSGLFDGQRIRLTIQQLSEFNNTGRIELAGREFEATTINISNSELNNYGVWVLPSEHETRIDVDRGVIRNPGEFGSRTSKVEALLVDSTFVNSGEFETADPNIRLTRSSLDNSGVMWIGGKGDGRPADAVSLTASSFENSGKLTYDAGGGLMLADSEIANSGEIDGRSLGVSLEKSSMTNSGQMVSGFLGIGLDRSSFENTGSIEAESGVVRLVGSSAANFGQFDSETLRLDITESSFANHAAINGGDSTITVTQGSFANHAEITGGDSRITVEAGSLFNTGTFSVSANSQLTLQSGFMTNSGEFRGGTLFIDKGSSLLNSGTLVIVQSKRIHNEGILNLREGHIEASLLLNNGSLLLGQKGIATLDGALLQGQLGTLAMSFGGRQDTRTLKVDGAVTLNGRLDVSFSGFIPGDLDELVILEAESVRGEFTDVPSQVGAGEFGYDLVYSDTSVVLKNFRRPAPERSAETGNYYEFVIFGGAEDRSWHTAEDGANARTYQGIQGHLVTITSAEEDQFLHDQSNIPDVSMWMGANDIEEEGVWKWVAGPEKGTVFWEGDGETGAGMGYSDWRIQEPNDFLGGEDGAVWNWYGGQWNDVPINGSGTRGYIVEYSVPAGDATGDGIVDLEDFAVFRRNFGDLNAETFVEGDFDGSNAVDLNDFNILKSNFGASAAAPVPEPASWLLAAVGLVLFLIQRGNACVFGHGPRAIWYRPTFLVHACLCSRICRRACASAIVAVGNAASGWSLCRTDHLADLAISGGRRPFRFLLVVSSRASSASCYTGS